MKNLQKLFASKSIKSNKVQKGFTLIELVLYVGILSILVGLMSSIFGQIVDVQLESEATSSVDQDGRYILSKMVYDVKSMNSGVVNEVVITPGTAGTQTPTLQIQVNSVVYTYSLDSDGNLLLANGTTGEVNRLNSVSSRLTGLSFQRIGSGAATDTVRVNFTVVSRGQQASGPESRDFQTSLARQ